MTPQRPYLLRAIHDWIVDNQLTPHLLVDATHAGVKVPENYVEEGRIVLNISHSAVQHLELGNEWIMFNARFNGVAMQIEVPMSAVMAIYAQENGRGLVIPDEPVEEGFDKSEENTIDDAKRPDDENLAETTDTAARKSRDTSHLKLIK